jgi:hypothetical protein
VRHADTISTTFGTRRALDEPFQQGNQALRALQREALVAEELVLQELLQHLGADHLVRMRRRSARVITRRLRVASIRFCTQERSSTSCRCASSTPMVRL